MTNAWKRLVLASAVLSLNATGLAFAQGAQAPAATPAAPMIDQGTANDLPAKPAMPGENADGARTIGSTGDETDRSIGRDAFMAKRIERLKAADTNGDGVLSKDELEAMVLKQMVERRAERIARRLDADGDGKVTLAEIERMRDKRFAVMDSNDDGKLDGRELRRLHHGMSERGQERPGWRHGHNDRGGRDG